VAGHPLRPATDHWLGRLLLYQLPNLTRAHLIAINLSWREVKRILALYTSCQNKKLPKKFLIENLEETTTHYTKSLFTFNSYSFVLLTSLQRMRY
jgi:hypothetical protein